MLSVIVSVRNTVYLFLSLQVRSFLELSEMLLAMDVPENTKKAWLDVM